MVAEIIDGRMVSASILQDLRDKLSIFSEKYNFQPKFAIILVGDNAASQLYVNNKVKAAQRVGIEALLIKFPSSVSLLELLAKIEELNHDASVHGIIVQLPLPHEIDALRVKEAIVAHKDVDGFHFENLGALFAGYEGKLIPCTALAILKLIEYYKRDIAGSNVVIVGRSAIVGRPTAALLLNRNCTVTMCHSHTKNLADYTRNADIVVAAVGRANFLTGEYFKESSMVIDVGINRIEREGQPVLVGDVDFFSAKERVSFITPVPGGVGPMTVACLLLNVYQAAINSNE